MSLQSLRQADSTLEEGSRAPVALDRFTLRFRDPQLESAFRADFFRHNLGNLRIALLAGSVLWAVFGLVLHDHILAVSDKRVDVVMRFGVFIPILLIGLALSFAPVFGRIWEWVVVTLTVATILGWVYYLSQVLTLPPDYGYVGLILITAFTFTLLRLRFVLVILITLVGLAAYLPYALVLVSEPIAERLADRYEFGPPLVLDLKGKGPTTARFLIRHRSDRSPPRRSSSPT